MPPIDPDPDSQLTLDDKVIERLRQDMGDEAGMVIEAYVESIDELLNNIHNRTGRTPGADLHRWAHTIKSSAAGIGAMRLVHLSAQLEHACRDRRRVDPGSQLQAMQGEYRRVNDLLQKNLQLALNPRAALARPRNSISACRCRWKSLAPGISLYADDLTVDIRRAVDSGAGTPALGEVRAATL